MCRFWKKIKPLEPTPLPEDHKPEIHPISAYQPAMNRIILEENIKVLYGWMDKLYYSTSLREWELLLHYIYVKEEAFEYITQTYDCEDFALWLKAMVSKHFQLNAFALVIGDGPTGKHAFNMFYTGEDFMLFEPNEGFYSSGTAAGIDDYGYEPQQVFI